ncbi:hypothetical protein BDF20DRAFT_891371 [Mycotypha africana]|uniref:uncharacterized protein n=1 Tax=Mycotypha africana TaxID=64632 RepID=UPI0023006D56|nr:uncharacterized protein BDF20DRAFT_891371 [Mycotypha africana]KAI8970454.1 hypothetical protein BDF20DRAFT_891371 [Mycotypha africana]
MASSVSLPLVVWHNFSNPNITCITSSSSQIYAGHKDGHIWVYSIIKQNNSYSLQHKTLLVGHKSAIVALCILKSGSDSSIFNTENVLISASEDGEIARWNASDGRCQAVNPNGFYGVPHALKVFTHFSDKHIFCCGQANEITILHATTLEVVRVWGGHSNWVTCMDFFDSDKNRWKLLSMTIDGKLDIWDFDVSKHIIYKDQAHTNSSLQLNDTTIFDLIGNKYMLGLYMTITCENVMIVRVENTKSVPKVVIPVELGTAWAGGLFVEKDRFVIWTTSGKLFDYSLDLLEKDKTKKSPVMEEDQMMLTARLNFTYSLKNDTDMVNNTIVTLLTDITEEDQLLALTISNHPTSTGFSILALSPPAKGSGVKETQYDIDRHFCDIWPIVEKGDPAFKNITVTAPVNTNHLAIGFESGTICVVPLSVALLHLTDVSAYVKNREDVRLFKNAHHSAITCMAVPEHHMSDQQYLVSGGKDGMVKIWNLLDGKYVTSCAVHSVPVEMLIEPAERKDSRVRGCIVSIGKDNSMAVISVDSMTCLYMFPGNPYPLKAIQWRTLEDYLILGYENGTAYVWQMQTAHLDRVLHEKNAQNVLDDDRWPTNHLTPSATQRIGTINSKQTATVRPITSNDNALHTSTSFAQVFTFNIRRLIHDLFTRVTIMNQGVSNQHQDSSMHPILKASISSSSFDQVVPDILTFKPDKDDPLDLSEENQHLNTSNTDNTSRKSEEARVKRIELITAILSIIASWNISEGLEEMCFKYLTINEDIKPNISFGLKGANGNLSIMAPLKNERIAWTISPSMTATRLLSIALLAKTVIFMARQENRSSDFISGYAMALPLVIGESYCFPSLSMLSKYWQDPSARSLFSSAISGLSEDDIEKLVDYWEAFLPTSSSPESSGAQMMSRASIVLGIMGCDQPHTLNPRVRKSTALSLTILLSDAELDDPSYHASNNTGLTLSTSSMARTLSSMELLSQGFQTWETYINAAEVLRTLFMYATDPHPVMAMISRGAKKAIFRISAANMPVVINTLTMDTMTAKSMDDRLRCLKLISIFIRKEPILLYTYIHSVVEAVISTLDPNIPHLRDFMLTSATSVLHDLVKIYPSVDFSAAAQKLAVGTLEGASVIYDVRTATRSVVLEGHLGPVSVLAFSPDAKLIATCSLADQSVRLWHTNLSLFGMLTSSLSQGLSSSSQKKSHIDNENSSTVKDVNTSSGVHKPFKIFSFAMPNNSLDPMEIIHQVSFDWISSKCVKLHVQDLVMSFNV